MSRAMYNATVIPDIIERISARYSVSETKAMDMYYTSITAQCLEDPETGLYGQGALFLFGIFEEEQENKYK